jgi:fibronectin-binding autotransporter adhesin
VTGSSAGALRVANGGVLNLNYSGTYAVGSFYTNGVALPVGTYNIGNLSGFITGTGNLQVTSGISSGLWTGGGADNNWSTGANWDNNAVPIFPHAVAFAGNNRLNNTNDLSSITLSSLMFDPAAGAFTLNGNDVTLSGNIGFSNNPAAPITQTVNFGMTFTGNQTITLPANGNLILGGNITSANSLVKAGLGTLTLGGASDSFSGFTITGGTNIIAGTVTVAGNNTRFYIGDIGTVGNMVIQPGAALNITGNFADAGVIGRDSGSGTVVQNGGTFSYNPANQGNFFVGASSSAATRAEYDMNGGTLDLNNYTLNVALSANGSTLITGVVNQVSGSINNVGKLDLGAFTFGPGHGIYRMSGGSIYIGGNGIVSDSGVYEIYLGGGTVGAYASWSSPLNMTLTGANGPVTFDTAGNLITLSGILSGPGGFNVTGGGTLELGGANTFAGDMTINAGMLQLDATGSSAGSLRMIDGTTLNLNFGGNYVVAGFYTNGVALLNGTYNSGNLPGFISGSGNLLVQGVSTGHWKGAGANSNWSTPANWDGNAVPIFPLGLTFGGSTRLNNNNDLTGVTATSLTFSNTAGAFTLNGNSLGLSGDINFNGNPAAPIMQTINLPLTVNANINLETPANVNLTINGDITAATNTVYKVDAGTLTLAGTNVFAGFDLDGGTNVITGNTTVTGTGGTRTYVANGDYVGGSVGTLVIQNGATFTINGNFADAYVIGRDGGRGAIIQNGGTFSFNPGNQTYLFLGAANNPATRSEYDMNGGLLDMNGKTLGVALGVNVLVTGVVNQVSGVITNVGQIFLDSFFSTGHSILNLTGGSLYIESGGITVQSGGSYEIYLGGGTVGAEASWSSSLNMVLTGSNGPVTFDPAGNTITLSGALSGSGGFTVSGGGILELSGANTYTGDTTVNAGSILRLDSTSNSSGTFRAANGAMLNLNYVGTMVVTNFYTNNVALAAGTYNSGNLPGYLSGAGSIQILGSGIPNTPTPISFSVGTGHITISWPANYQGWILQQQTNSLNAGLGTNWVDVAGSASMTSTNIPINPATPAAFYRLRYPTP